jgi:hypothetical protein
MSKPTILPQGLRTDLVEWDPRQTEPRPDDQAVTDLGYLPASPQRFDIRTLEEWIDLCA